MRYRRRAATSRSPRRLAITSWALGLAIAGASRGESPPALGHIETLTLDNGLTVILAPVRHDHGLISVRLRIHVGSSADPPRLIGLAHLVEHVVATLPWDGGGDVFDYLCRRAPQVSCNAETSSDTTDFYATMPRQYLPLALWAHTQFLGASRTDFRRVLVARERAIVKNEIRQKIDEVPYTRASLRLGELLGVPLAGVASDEAAIESLAEVDEGPVADFYVRHYGPRAATLVITGDFPLDWAREILDDTVARVPTSKVGPTAAPSAQPVGHGGRERYPERPGVAPALLVGWPSPAFFAQGDAAGDVLADVLGGPGGRLSARIGRPGGPVAALSAQQASRIGTSAFIVQLQLYPAQSLGAVESQLDAAVADIAAHGVTAEELAASRAHWHTHLVARLETPEDRSNAFLSWHDYKGEVAAGFAADWRRYDELKSEDLQAFARDVLAPARRVSVEAVATPTPASP